MISNVPNLRWFVSETQFDFPPLLSPLQYSPSLFITFTHIHQNLCTCFTFHKTVVQSSYVWSKCRPRYLKFVTHFIIVPPSLPYKLNSISLHLSVISTFLLRSCIYIAFSYIIVCLCFISCTPGICIPKLSHIGGSSGSSCITATFAFHWQYMKCFPSLPKFFALDGHPYTGHISDFSTHGKYTMYVSAPPLPTSTLQACERNILWVLSAWWKSNDAVISPHNTCGTPWFYSTPRTWSPILSIYSCTPMSPVVPKWKSGCTTLLWSHHDLLAAPPYWTSLSLPPGFLDSDGIVPPLYGRRLHKIWCCVPLSPNSALDMPPQICRLPTEPPLPMHPPQCWKFLGLTGPPVSPLSPYQFFVQSIYWPSKPPHACPSTAVVTSIN